MNRLLMTAAAIALTACGGVSTQNGNSTGREGLNGSDLDLQRKGTRR